MFLRKDMPCESKKMSYSSVEHGAVTQQEALGMARKDIKAGLCPVEEEGSGCWGIKGPP